MTTEAEINDIKKVSGIHGKLMTTEPETNDVKKPRHLKIGKFEDSVLMSTGDSYFVITKQYEGSNTALMLPPRRALRGK